jgi:hypothetical protein
MKISFYAIVWVTAIILAISSAFYSVFGLSQLFSGAVIAIITVASILESSKVILATYIHDYWNSMSKILKIYMTFALGCLMIITSLGVYGFLTSAYQDTIKTFKLKQGDIAKIEIKIENFKKQTLVLDQNEQRIQKQIESIQLSKTNQDNAISNVYSSSKNKNTRLLEKSLTATNTLLERISQELSNIQAKKSAILDSINLYESKKLEIETNNEVSEVGPLLYISKALGINMDSVVNYLVLLIMLVFDPLAVALVFAANSIKKKNDFDSKEKKSILLDSTGELDAINDIADDINEINTNKIENVETILEENTPVEIQTESVVTQTQENTDLYGEPENKIKYSRMVKIR